MQTIKEHEAVEALRADLAQIELDVLTNYTVADAMREAAPHIKRQHRGGWFTKDSACALSAAAISATARGYI